jgi:hypothetical protein
LDEEVVLNVFEEHHLPRESFLCGLRVDEVLVKFGLNLGLRGLLQIEFVNHLVKFGNFEFYLLLLVELRKVEN